MERTFTGNRPSRGNIDEQDNIQLLESDLSDFQTMSRNLFVGGAEQEQSNTSDDERTSTGYATQLEEQFHIPAEARRRHSRHNTSRLERPMESSRTTELEERTRPAAIVATRNSLALSNVVVPTRPIAKPYQEGFKIPRLETYDGSGDLDKYLHTYQAIMRIQNATDAMMCKVFPVTLKSTARRWYHKLPRHSVASYSELATLFSNKFASQREIKRTANELMQVHQKKGESLRDYMQWFNKSTLNIDNVPDTICLFTLLHGLKPDQFLDNLLENPSKSWNEVNDRSASFILSKNFQSPKREPMTDRIQHWVKRPPPQMHDFPRANRSKYCDYHHGYSHNIEDCQSLKDELEFLARNGKLEGYGSPYSSEAGRTYKGRPFNRRGQGQKTSMQNQKDHRVVGYNGIPPPSGTINMIFGGMHSGGQKAEWENTPITFSPIDYKRLEGEPDVMMPHVDPFMATIHVGNHNANKVFIDKGSSPDILYWSCFQKMQLNPNSLRKYEGPIYEFDNQPIPVKGVITLPIYVGVEPRFRMASVDFLVVNMESTFNARIGRATLCELKAVISQPHLYMKFPTSQGVEVLNGNQKMART
ncbi:hypothetical protein SLEP1_g8795 [Rubroshorea leprosula]|uniref:Retrotransposon gag domain-containing protein n=1 Tax=Rubroshorea leprosula TaxID=152421 RepID=A0AAV5IB74_9ROSI|nr:hypothetical protein SLEP1_g8795 [Rubroshorea leprosula]